VRCGWKPSAWADVQPISVEHLEALGAAGIWERTFGGTHSTLPHSVLGFVAADRALARGFGPDGEDGEAKKGELGGALCPCVLGLITACFAIPGLVGMIECVRIQANSYLHGLSPCGFPIGWTGYFCVLSRVKL
jgi:hypothetical protein